MKYLILISLSIISFSFLSFCNTTGETDLSQEPLVGKIGGADWTYVAGNAYFDQSSTIVNGMLLDFRSSDPCSWISVSQDHIELSFPSQTGTYDLTSGSFTSDDYGTAVFKTLSPSQNLYAYGYVQIFSISKARIVGYINAQVDNDNYVKGSFQLSVCN